MLTLNEIVGLRKNLIDGEIRVDQAKNIFWKDYKEGSRSWHTKDWKIRRAQFIKERCQICSSKESLTLQHLSHPKKLSDYERYFTKHYTRAYIEDEPTVVKKQFAKHIKENYEYNPVPLCPNCEGRHPNKRSTKKPQYLCTNCRHEFDEPIKKTIDELIALFYEDDRALEARTKCFITKDKWRNRHHLKDAMYWLQRELAKIENDEKIRKAAFLLYLDDQIKYLSFEDTITACKKCAFNYDINNLELCPKCNEYYKGVQYPSCITCLSDDKKKAISDNARFKKEWEDMHRRLGID